MHNMIKHTLKSQIVMNRKLKDYTKKERVSYTWSA